MTNLIDALHIPDTQSARDDRRLAIQRVGVRGVRYPIQLRIEGVVVPTVAEWSLDVALPAEQKGTHMSRFVAWLDAIEAPLDAATLRSGLAAMLDKLHAVEGRMHTTDLHATLLALMGLDHEQLTYRYAGRDFRLTDVAGSVVSEIMS